MERLEYNLYVKKIILMLCFLWSTIVFPSRAMDNVFFNVSLPNVAEIVPFTVVVPEDFTGQFVRFIHPTNGKSAVAKVIKREGSKYKTNLDLAKAIGIRSNVASVYIEEVY